MKTMSYPPEQVTIAPASKDLLSLLDDRIAKITRSVVDEAMRKATHQIDIVDDAPAKLREQLALIRAKEHITVREAALLMSCSHSHIRKLVMLARKRKTGRPIPFVELEGVTVFPLASLIEWTNARTHWRVITNEAA